MKKNTFGPKLNTEFKEEDIVYINVNKYSEKISQNVGIDFNTEDIGLIFLSTIDPYYNDHYYQFKIVDRKKYIWAKIKYGI